MTALEVDVRLKDYRGGNGAGGGEPRIGYVFQNPVLLPWRTVAENLRLVMRPEQVAEGPRQLLLRTWRAKPTTVLFATHDSREAIELAQRLIVLCGTPARIVLDQTIDLTAAQGASFHSCDKNAPLTLGSNI